jgi:hypothetical protein
VPRYLSKRTSQWDKHFLDVSKINPSWFFHCLVAHAWRRENLAKSTARRMPRFDEIKTTVSYTTTALWYEDEELASRNFELTCARNNGRDDQSAARTIPLDAISRNTSRPLTITRARLCLRPTSSSPTSMEARPETFADDPGDLFFALCDADGRRCRSAKPRYSQQNRRDRHQAVHDPHPLQLTLPTPVVSTPPTCDVCGEGA